MANPVRPPVGIHEHAAQSYLDRYRHSSGELPAWANANVGAMAKTEAKAIPEFRGLSFHSRNHSPQNGSWLAGTTFGAPGESELLPNQTIGTP
jgi:hypothetical protein